MARIKFPDGSAIDFPDDTPPETVNRVAAEHWAQNAPKKPSYVDATAGVAQAALQGLGASFGDEISAGVGATLDSTGLPGLLGNQDRGKNWSERYGNYLKEARGDFEKYRKTDPWGSFGITAASGIAPALATGGTSIAPTVTGRVLQGAGTGAAWGTASGFGSGQGDVFDAGSTRLQSAGGGAAAGAALGGTISGVAPHVVNAFKYLMGKVPAMFTAQGALSDEAKAGLKTLGIDADAIGSDVLSQIKRDMGESLGARAQAAVDPREMATNLRIREAETLPVRVPSTRGMVTQDPAEQMFENQARQGGYGQVIQNVMRPAYRQSEDALRANVPAIQAQISGERVPQVSERGQGGAAVANKLQGMYAAKKGAVDTAYEATREGSSAGVPAGNVARGAFEMGMELSHRGFSPGSVPRVHDILKNLESYRAASGERDFFPFVRTLISSRSALTALSQSSDKFEAKAAGDATKLYDDWLNSLLNKALVSGNKKSIEQFQAAIGQRRELGRVFESNDLVHELTHMEYRSGQRVFSAAPEDASNIILGRAQIPQLDKRNLGRDLLQLKNVVGQGKEWDALREEVFLRFAEKGLHGQKRGEETLFAGANLATAWHNAQRTAKPVLDALYTKEEQGVISQWVRVAQRNMSPVEGGAPLGSGMSNIQVLRNVGALAFAGPKVQALLNTLPGVGKLVATAAALPRAMRAANPKAVRAQPSNRRLVRGVVSGVVPTLQ